MKVDGLGDTQPKRWYHACEFCGRHPLAVLSWFYIGRRTVICGRHAMIIVRYIRSGDCIRDMSTLKAQMDRFKEDTRAALLVFEAKPDWADQRRILVHYFEKYNVAVPATDEALRVAAHSMRIQSPYVPQYAKTTSAHFLRAFHGVK